MSPPLDKLNRWVTTPSIYAGLIGFALAVAYAITTIRFPEGTRLSLVLIGVAVVAIANLLGDRAEQVRLKAVRALASGAVPKTPQHLGPAAVELARLPGVSFASSLGFWCGSTVLIGALWAGWSGAPLELALRAVFIGLACGPAVSVLAYLLVLIRCRAAIGALVAAGLPAATLYRLLPPLRQALARRLFFFSAVTVLTPLVFVVDLGLGNLERVLDAALVSADAASAQAAFVAVEREALAAAASVLAMVLSLAVASAWFGGTALGQPLAALAEQTRAFAQGRLERVQVVPAEDEVWAASVAFGSTAAQLEETARRLGETGSRLGATVAQLAASATRHTEGGADQRAALAQTSTTTEELANSAREVSARSSQVAEMAQRTVAAAQAGKRSADAFYASIVQVREGNQAVADSVVKLNKRVQQVGRIVEFIDGIADRSDLLAVNAELEGTKAGEVGRGFSLVAAEMRRLSESVMGSTREISRLIEEIRDATNAAVMATEAGVKATDVGRGLAQKVSSSFDSILQYANLTSDAVKSITISTQQQQAGTDQLALAMEEILKSTEEAASASGQMLAANGDLALLARDLEAAVERVRAR